MHASQTSIACPATTAPHHLSLLSVDDQRQKMVTRQGEYLVANASFRFLRLLRVGRCLDRQKNGKLVDGLRNKTEDKLEKNNHTRYNTPMPKTKNAQNTFTECPCAGATLDKLIQPAMLAILAKGPLHGYKLAQKVGDIPHFLDDAPDVSGVYRILKTLETRGMVTADWDISQSGRPKRLFTITNAGRQCLEHWVDTLQNYHKTIGSLLKTTQKAVRQ